MLQSRPILLHIGELALGKILAFFGAYICSARHGFTGCFQVVISKFLAGFWRLDLDLAEDGRAGVCGRGGGGDNDLAAADAQLE